VVAIGQDFDYVGRVLELEVDPPNPAEVVSDVNLSAQSDTDLQGQPFYPCFESALRRHVVRRSLGQKAPDGSDAISTSGAEFFEKVVHGSKLEDPHRQGVIQGPLSSAPAL
jgi:hypothetical protein